MVEVTLAANVVRLVINDGKRYVDAIDEVFPDERKIFQSSNISVLLAKQALKHFFLFENIINELQIELNSKQRSLLYVVLANNFYAHVIRNNNVNSFIENELDEEQFNKIKPVLTRKEPLEELISFERNSDFYYATKYNCPIWLVHMWRKHFGDQTVEDFLEASMNYNLQSYVVNTLKSSLEDIMLKYPDFSSPFKDMLIYQGTRRYTETQEFKNDSYIDVKVGFKTFIDSIYDPFKEMLLYSGYDDDFAKTLIIKTDKKQGLNIAVPNLDKRASLMRFIRTNAIHNVNLFEAKDEFGLKAGVSYEQDTVVVFPESTRFDIASKYPDYLLHFDRDSLDEILSKEKEALELCAPFVNEGGQLIYIVNTLNKKESTLMIQEFLNNHPNFTLVSEEQMLASHPFATTMYYAILSRGEEND